MPQTYVGFQSQILRGFQFRHVYKVLSVRSWVPIKKNPKAIFEWF